jgi:hypothetical protein
MTLTHGRTRRRWAQNAVLVLFVILASIVFGAWAFGLALLIWFVTN